MENDEGGDGAGSKAVESVKEAKPVRVSYHLIAKRNLPLEGKVDDQEEIMAALNDITHLRLDRENIKYIDSLELLGPQLTNIYLQHNVIEKIENFDCVKNLQFLALSNNHIRTVENLAHLPKLYFLDLSCNLIQDFDIDEFPQSLIMLDLRENPCVHTRDYRGRILQDLANLTLLDGEEVTAEEKLEVGFAPDSPDLSEEESAGVGRAGGWGDPYTAQTHHDEPQLNLADRGRIRSIIFGKEPVLPDLGSGSLSQLREDMMRRSEQRRQEMDVLHLRRRQEMDVLLQAMPRPSSAKSPQPSPLPPPAQLPSLSPTPPSGRPPSQK